MNINFTQDQVDELTGMIKASKIRMSEWIRDAATEKEALHISAMLDKRKEFEVYILASIKKSSQAPCNIAESD